MTPFGFWVVLAIVYVTSNNGDRLFNALFVGFLMLMLSGQSLHALSGL